MTILEALDDIMQKVSVWCVGATIQLPATEKLSEGILRLEF